jgi:redox-sensitive bicupin YhaK (pirin superfamily)
MQSVFHPAGERGYAKQGWLETHHSFSFASYYNPQMMGFGVLRVINDDVIAPGQGFGRHPHENMEIITIPLSGSLTHEDSMGNRAVIHTGEVQVMSAGTGVEHSEYNASQTEAVSLLQIWIETRMAGVVPRYAQKIFDNNLFNNNLYLVVGPEESEKDGALFIHQDAFLSLGRFDIDTDVAYTLHRPGNGAYFFVMEGEAMIGDQALGRRDALGVWESEKVLIQAKKDASLLCIEVPMG